MVLCVGNRFFRIRKSLLLWTVAVSMLLMVLIMIRQTTPEIFLTPTYDLKSTAQYPQELLQLLHSRLSPKATPSCHPKAPFSEARNMNRFQHSYNSTILYVILYKGGLDVHKDALQILNAAQLYGKMNLLLVDITEDGVYPENLIKGFGLTYRRITGLIEATNQIWQEFYESEQYKTLVFSSDSVKTTAETILMIAASLNSSTCFATGSMTSSASSTEENYLFVTEYQIVHTSPLFRPIKANLTTMEEFLNRVENIEWISNVQRQRVSQKCASIGSAVTVPVLGFSSFFFGVNKAAHRWLTSDATLFADAGGGFAHRMNTLARFSGSKPCLCVSCFVQQSAGVSSPPPSIAVQSQAWVFIQTGACCISHDALLRLQLEYYIYQLSINPANIILDIHVTEDEEDQQKLIAEKLRFTANVYGLTRVTIAPPSVFTAVHKATRMYSLEKAYGVPSTDWVLVSDSDELINLLSFPVAAVIRHLNTHGYEAVQAEWVDRFAEKGELKEIIRDTALAQQFPIRCRNVYASFYPQNEDGVVFVLQKISMRRPYVLLDGGNHRVLENQEECVDSYKTALNCDNWNPQQRKTLSFGSVEHFKWHAEGRRSVQSAYANAMKMRDDAASVNSPRFARIAQKYAKILNATQNGFLDLSPFECNRDRTIEKSNRDK